MSDTTSLLSLEYIRRRDNKNELLERVITTHLFTEYILNRIITEKRSDYKTIINKWGYAAKLKMLKTAGIMPEKLNHNLNELNHLRNSYAHNLELEKDTVLAFYENMDKADMSRYKITDRNFDNGVELLCQAAFIDLADLAFDLKVDTKYKHKLP